MLDLLGAFTYVFAGWRFLISSRFRESTMARWATMRQMEVAQDVVGGAAGILFSILLPVFAWWSLPVG